MTITAIITTFAREYIYAERAIQSIINQTHPVDEIIVVDDNDRINDYSSEIMKMCKAYSIVKYIRQEYNKGACSSRNLGISKAKGEYIAFLDDDDVWLPHKIEKQVEAFEKADSRVGMVFCSGLQKDMISGEESKYYNYTSKSKVSFEDLLGYDYIGTTSNPLIKRECFDIVGGFWEEQPARQDYEMWLRIAQQFKIIGINDICFVYNVHRGSQITKSQEKSYIGFRNIYRRYRKDYMKNPRAWINILTCIIRNRYTINSEVIGYWLLRQIIQIRYRMPRNQW